MKDRSAAWFFPVLRWLLRFTPFEAGRRWVYEVIVRPRLSWRTFNSVAQLRSGPRVGVALPDMIDERLYFFGVWEPEITDYVSRVLKPGDTFIDVGANIGYFSLVAASIVGPRGCVVAVEASPSIYESLIRNIRMNEFSNVIAYHMAASDKSGVLPIFLDHSANRGSSTTVSTVAVRKAQDLESQVKADTLVSIVGEATLFGARLIKIDVEGAEFQVISGISRYLDRFHKDTEWLIEISPRAMEEQGQSVEEFLAFFRSSGYEIFRIRNDYKDGSYLQKTLAPYIVPLDQTPSGLLADLLIRRKVL